MERENIVSNPYLAPGAALSDAPGDTYQPRVFAWKGRLGRLRYLSYLCCAYLLSMVVLGLAGAALSVARRLPDPASWEMLLSIVFYIPVLGLSLAWAKRRFNDVNRSGWLVLLLVIPVVNFFVGLYLAFAGGSEGANDYGPPPAPNPVLVKIVGLLLPLLIIGGTVAVMYPAIKLAQERMDAGSSSGRL
ncbi:Uncharacterized membrane protein YhaH, DUF805 family [Pseudoduganella namucuonensis]|uniref:Uncharacterized membrane protein YhaH, DUF805 family n=1 Tax=Pseudoduganella namucuonensis TaxID=1035707 RepID=A0A1I7IJT3_9BURK|nr:Uncharacterized membrane protein YhaH, DUF805 family [Pseudoduganella namucuonensis]